MGANMTRIERSDGRLFQARAEDVKDFLKNNPGSKVVRGFTPSDEPTPAEAEASRVVNLPARRGRGRNAAKGETAATVEDVAQDGAVNVENGGTTNDGGAEASTGTAAPD